MTEKKPPPPFAEAVAYAEAAGEARAQPAPAVALRYVKEGVELPNVPARDLTAAETAARMTRGQYATALADGIYERAASETPDPAPKEG